MKDSAPEAATHMPPTIFERMLPEVRVRDRVAAFSWLYLAGWTFVFVLYAVAAAWQFEAPLFDGGLQMFNPLRRLAAGQTLGMDFQFYHGIGIPFLHYPIFALLGKNAFASEFARHFVTLIAFLAVLLSLGRTITSSWKFTGLFVIAFMSLWELTGLGYRFLPGNSLVSLRSALPFIFFALLASRISRRKKTLFIPATLAICFWVSLEQGLATWGAYFLATSFFLLCERDLKSLAKLAGQFLAAASIYVVLALLCCGIEGFKTSAQFYFVIAPADQFWYFGAPPNSPLTDLSDLFRWPRLVGMGAVVLMLIFVIAHRRLRRQDTGPIAEARWHSALTMLLYGIFSTIVFLSYGSPGHMAILGFALLVILVAICFLMPLESLMVGKIDFLKNRAIAGAAYLLLFGGLFLNLVSALWALSYSFKSYGQYHESKLPSEFPLNDINGQYLQSAIATIDSRSKQIKQGDIWSTYSGLLEAHYSIFNPSSDYIIHALGPKLRREYLNHFRETRPRFVQTVNPTYSQYEEWNQNTSWPFYEELFTHYRLLATTTPFLIWEKSDEAAKEGDGWVDLPVTGNQVILTPKPGGFRPGEVVIMKIRYRVSTPFSWIPVLGRTPRFLIIPENARQRLGVSLSPDDNERTFPLVPIAGKPIRLHWEVKSLLPGAKVEVTGASYRTIRMDPSTLDAMTARQAFR